VTAVAGQPPRPAKPRASFVVPLGILAFLVITWASLSEQFGIAFDLGSLWANITAGGEILINERFADRPAQRGLLLPNWAFLDQTRQPLIETFQIAVIASTIGCAVALPIAFVVSRITTPNAPTFIAGRTLLSVVRAIPDYLYALMFVAVVSVGPLAGIAALFFFNIGVVAKLLSETVDGVDLGPIEAARAGGSNRTQTVRWAVLPQVLPNYVAYALYTFELNIRAATVIGIAGAGGIGQLLRAQYGFFNWSNVSVIIIVLFVAVFLIEMVSIWLRRRLV
jgi:phosphonate transport system permease protein